MHFIVFHNIYEKISIGSVCVCVCVYDHIYIYIYICMDTYIHTCMYVYIYIHVSIYIYIHIFGWEDWGPSDFRTSFLGDMTFCVCSRFTEVWQFRLHQLVSEYIEIIMFCSQSNEICHFRCSGNICLLWFWRRKDQVPKRTYCDVFLQHVRMQRFSICWYYIASHCFLLYIHLGVPQNTCVKH